MINLADPRIGSKVIFKTDDFFAAAHRILNIETPVFKDGLFDKHGKWMDGWETRRRRSKGFDYLILKLGKPGKIFDIDIDTTHFNGNQPTHASLEGCLSKTKPNKKTKWISLLSKKKLRPSRNHSFKSKNKSVFNYIRLNIFPDGGVARLRLYGKIEMEKNLLNNKTINLTSVLNGASIIGCNNEHFGRAENIIAPGRGKNMGDGWETRRRREPGNDWLIIKLGKKSFLTKAEVDTAFFKGNYPESCSIQAINTDDISKVKDEDWLTIIPKSILHADKVHKFSISTKFHSTEFSHIKLNIFPDGGVSRLRIFGHI